MAKSTSKLFKEEEPKEMLEDAMDIIAGQRELIAEMQDEIRRLKAENKRGWR